MAMLFRICSVCSVWTLDFAWQRIKTVSVADEADADHIICVETIVAAQRGFCWQSVSNTMKIIENMKIITTATTMKRMKKVSIRMTWHVGDEDNFEDKDDEQDHMEHPQSMRDITPELHPFLLKMLLVQLVLLVILVLLVPSFTPPRPFPSSPSLSTHWNLWSQTPEQCTGWTRLATRCVHA